MTPIITPAGTLPRWLFDVAGLLVSAATPERALEAARAMTRRHWRDLVGGEGLTDAWLTIEDVQPLGESERVALYPWERELFRRVSYRGGWTGNSMGVYGAREASRVMARLSSWRVAPSGDAVFDGSIARPDQWSAWPLFDVAGTLVQARSEADAIEALGALARAASDRELWGNRHLRWMGGSAAAQVATPGELDRMEEPPSERWRPLADFRGSLSDEDATVVGRAEIVAYTSQWHPLEGQQTRVGLAGGLMARWGADVTWRARVLAGNFEPVRAGLPSEART